MHPLKSSQTILLQAASCLGLLVGCEQKDSATVQSLPAVGGSKPVLARNVTLYQDNEYELIGPAQHYATIVRVGSPLPSLPSDVDTLFRNRDISVLGDTTLRGSSLEVYRRFTYRHAFTDFPVTTPAKGRPRPVDFKSNPAARRHMTRIREGAQQPANFAGHYRLITWGCGSTCQQSVLVDQQTGRVYNAPETAQGLSYRLDSQLLITDYIEDGEAAYLVNSVYPIPAFYLWTGREFQKLD